MDFYFLFFIYLLVGGGSSYVSAGSYQQEKKKRALEGTLLFPFLISNPADKVSSYLHECVGEVTSLREGGHSICAKSLRYGSIHECALRKERDAGNYRGNWYDKDQGNSENYMDGCTELLTIAAMALNNYPDSRGKVHPPTCDCFFISLSSDEQQKLNNFLSELLKGPYDIVTPESHLHPFAYALFASFLRWLPDFKREVGVHHCSLEVLKKYMLVFEYTWDTFDAWSLAVRDSFAAQNVLSLAKVSDEIPPWVAQLYQSQLRTESMLQKELKVIKLELQEIKKNMYASDSPAGTRKERYLALIFTL